jgi:hypothetical protein
MLGLMPKVSKDAFDIKIIPTLVSEREIVLWASVNRKTPSNSVSITKSAWTEFTDLRISCFTVNRDSLGSLPVGEIAERRRGPSRLRSKEPKLKRPSLIGITFLLYHGFRSIP